MVVKAVIKNKIGSVATSVDFYVNKQAHLNILSAAKITSVTSFLNPV